MTRPPFALTLQTRRLELVAAEPHVAVAEATGVREWYAHLRVPPPSPWPPPLNNAESITWFARCIHADPPAIGWYGWYVVRLAPARVLVGNCGFKGRPDQAGTIEIGYSLLPAHQRQGLGTELVAALLAWAFAHSAVRRVMAETQPDLTGSVRLLEKHGFQLLGRGSAPDTILYELRRSVFERRRDRSADGILQRADRRDRDADSIA
jgi:[ribosomal protein S5]-alanine N-acetyltransferase